ncbi:MULTISPECIES: DUF2357 domain-containing protein [Pseudomonas]|uniref:DUF2357 domain-containing protein n=1 Tax=Pseudomonas TaxID=286 RepID=UPI001E3F27FF|nr:MULTISPECIES: DUF2357 domain-containing protein [Pseudomonas]MCE1117416.1 restriction endonuclease-like protein [Pseudomonas sp. NMI795_08]
MLTIRKRASQEVVAQIGVVLDGFEEDIEYRFKPDQDGCTLYVDDEELSSSRGWFRWTPKLYAGRVRVEVLRPTGSVDDYFLQVGSSTSKADNLSFEEMVAQIRALYPRQLGGISAATLAFGSDGRPALFPDLVLLARLRQHGHNFLAAVEQVARTPHVKLQAKRGKLPLSQVRRLHPVALRDPKLSALIRNPALAAKHSNMPVSAWTSGASVDTQANRALLALLQRFRAAVCALRRSVAANELQGTKKHQELRSRRRIALLAALDARVLEVLRQHPFPGVTAAASSASGAAQVAAQPSYGKAYRLGTQALALGVEGHQLWDQLHASHSWGIYEMWCFVQILHTLQGCTGNGLRPAAPTTVEADLCWRAELGPDHSLELLYQGVFPKIQPTLGHEGFSISRKRIPDILIVERKGRAVRLLILDAKWRSGEYCELDAMESAHLYHDSLRLGDVRPDYCLLMLPGTLANQSLGQDDFITRNRVGVMAQIHPRGAGLGALHKRIEHWLSTAQNHPA